MSSLTGLPMAARQTFFLRAMKKIQKSDGVSTQSLVEAAGEDPTADWVVLFCTMSIETMKRTISDSKDSIGNNNAIIKSHVDEAQVIATDKEAAEAALTRARMHHTKAQGQLNYQEGVYKDVTLAASINQLETQQLVLLNQVHSFFVAYGDYLVHTPTEKKPFGKPGVTIAVVKGKVKIHTWDDIMALKITAKHAVINVLAVHGYIANQDFVALWQKNANNALWIGRNGPKPVIHTGRVRDDYKLAVRLADYLDIPVPESKVPAKVSVPNTLGTVEEDDADSEDDVESLIAKLQARGYSVSPAKKSG